MSQFKRAQVIILQKEGEPQKGDLILRHGWKDHPQLECKSLWQYNETITIDNVRQYTTLNSSFRDLFKAFELQHLYIISDDEIKKGDWCFEIHNESTTKAPKNTPRFTDDEGNIWWLRQSSIDSKGKSNNIKKIISTTDKLYTQGYTPLGCSIGIPLPQPSQQFIEKYIEEYNKGNIIENILFEYEIKWQTSEKSKVFSTPKINSKDNTITIKKLKDSWNREEVIEQMWLAYKSADTIFDDEKALRIQFDKWVKENL